MVRKFPLFDIYWDENDIKKLTNVIKRGSYWAVGPEIEEFEENLASYLDKKYVVTFNSGTSALHAALLAYNITGGEVIVPSLSFISTANCVILAGSKPVFAEIEEDTLGLDPEDVKEKINKNTKAIIPMHYGGKVCNHIEELVEIADNNNLILIEDAAESFGAKSDNKFAGTFGEAGMFSFCQNKIITTGEGGAICTEDADIFAKLKLIRSHGRVDKEDIDFFSNIDESEYIEIGYNYRMPAMCAALGISQLQKVEDIIHLRRKIGQFYDQNLINSQHIEIIPEIKGQRTVYQLYSIFLKNPEVRKNLQNYLLENQIYTKVYFHPIHLKKFYRENFNFDKGHLPITEKISRKLLSLPLSFNFTQEEQMHIIQTIESFFDRQN
jgi:perosamine synthetase